MRAGGEILEDLDKASKGLQAASTELSELVTHFHEGGEGPDGEIVLGIGLQFDIKLKEEIAGIYTDAIEEGKRAPAEDVRLALAHKAIQVKHPGLFAEYYSKKSRIEALRLWINSQKSVISACQSLLKGERE